MRHARKAYVVWNEVRSEGVIFVEKRSADSALDGQHRPDPDLGGARAISTLAESFHDIYGEDKCIFETVEVAAIAEAR